MLSPSEALLALVVSLFILQFLKFRWASRKLPPGPTPLPIIGNLWALGFQMDFEILIKLAKTYGNMYTVWMGQTPVVVLNGCKAVRNALITHSEELSGRPTTPFFDAISNGKGVIFISGPTWKQQRRLGMIALRTLGVGKKVLELRIQQEAQRLVESFSATQGKATDPFPTIVHSVSNVLSIVTFGHRFNSNDKVFHQIIDATDCLINFMGSMSGMLFHVFPWLMRRLPGLQQKMFKCNSFMESFLKQEIRSHKENGIPEEPHDVIDFYLSQISKGSDDPTSTCNEENLIRLVIDLFMAGTETTTTALRWSIIHMLNHPDIQEKVHQELDTILGTSQIEYEDRKRLPYTKAVLHEVLRFSNVAAVGIVRQVVKETTLQGYHMEKGTIVLPNLASVLCDPENWETPRQFNPGHFLDKEGNFVTNEAFLPFSAGHRVCLGEQLSRIVSFLFFTNLLRSFTLRLPEGVKEASTDYILGSTCKPYPFETCAVPR